MLYIKITRESTEEEVAKFLKVKLGFSDKAIEALVLDGDGLLSICITIYYSTSNFFDSNRFFY